MYKYGVMSSTIMYSYNAPTRNIKIKNRDSQERKKMK